MKNLKYIFANLDRIEKFYFTSPEETSFRWRGTGKGIFSFFMPTLDKVLEDKSLFYKDGKIFRKWKITIIIKDIYYIYFDNEEDMMDIYNKIKDKYDLSIFK